MKQPVQYRLEERQIEQLKEIKQRTGISEADLVRQALDTHLPFMAEEGLPVEIMAEAAKTYEDALTNPQRIHRLAAGWFYDRQDNSKRGALKRLEERMETMERAIQLICARLGIDLEAIDYDTDHA